MREAFTSELEIPLALKIGGSLAFVALLCYIGYSMISHNQQEYECFTHAKEWVETIEGHAKEALINSVAPVPADAAT